MMNVGTHQKAVVELRTDWMDSASCSGTDPSLWFPEQGGDNGKAAKRICGRCPVELDCLEFALSREDGMPRDRRHGVWGGQVPLDRWRIARRPGLLAVGSRGTHDCGPPDLQSDGPH